MTKVTDSFRDYAKAPKVNNSKGKDVHVNAIKEYVGVEVHLHEFLSFTLDGVSGKLHALAALASRKWPQVHTE
jgi:hypothetical protein